jgi:hypothetical protein
MKHLLLAIDMVHGKACVMAHNMEKVSTCSTACGTTFRKHSHLDNITRALAVITSKNRSRRMRLTTPTTPITLLLTGSVATSAPSHYLGVTLSESMKSNEIKAKLSTPLLNFNLGGG